MKYFVFSLFLAVIALSSSAFTTTPDEVIVNVVESIEDYSLTVHVSHGDGGNYSGAKVAGLVCGSLGGMTETVYTDSYGNATLHYSSNADLCKIFINGNTNKGRWSNGETARFRD